MMRLITNRDPISDEFFLRDGNVYFCGLYENTLLKAVDSKEFLCWYYWGSHLRAALWVEFDYVARIQSRSVF